MQRPQDLRRRITQTEGDLVVDVVGVLVAGLMQAAVALRFLLRENPARRPVTSPPLSSDLPPSTPSDCTDTPIQASCASMISGLR